MGETGQARRSLVGEAVGKALEEGIAGQVCHNNPLAHCQGLCSGSCHHVTRRRVHKNPAIKQKKQSHKLDLLARYTDRRDPLVSFQRGCLLGSHMSTCAIDLIISNIPEDSQKDSLQMLRPQVGA